MFRAFLAVLVLVALASPGVQSAEVELDGQVRVRIEGEDRTHRDQEVIWFILQRTRIGMRASVSDEVDLYFQMQDSRRYGNEQIAPAADPTLTPTMNVDLHQGWAEIRKSWRGNATELRFGRQELSYGNERIIGTVGWSNVGRSFDGLRTRSTRGNWRFDLGALRLAQVFSGPTDERASDSDDLFLSYNSYRFTDHDARGEFYVMYRDDDLGFYETTLGEHANGRFGRLRFDQEFAAQLGSRLGEDLEAFLFAAQVHGRLHRIFEVGAGFDFLSGDKDTLDTKFQAFDIRRIFSTGHKFYGLMDSAVGLAGPAGLLDPYVRLGFNGPRDLLAQIVVHRFYTQHKYFVGSDRIRRATGSAYLGTEVDGTLSFAMAPRTRLEIGGALLFPGGSLKSRQVGGVALDKTAVWAYAQGIASF